MSLPRDRSPYSGGSEGAPPTPPPGGYRGSRRVPLGPPFAPPPAATAGPAQGGPRPSVLSVVALAASGLFALVLLVLWAAGATSAIYGVATLALQLALVIVVIAAVVSARGRLLGSIAIALVLLVNVGTIGAASAVTRPPAVVAAPDPETDHWLAYPGIRGQTADEILARDSLEAVAREGDALMAAIRARLTARFGFDWVPGVPGTTRHERNGYGGESMLVTYDSDNWATTQAIRDHDEKLAVMAAIDEVLATSAFDPLYPLNDPATGFDPDYLERFYGSTDVRTQSLWEWASGAYSSPLILYVNVSDFTHDDDGSFRARREGQVGDSGEPLEGLRISMYAPEVLSEADVAEFRDRMSGYPG